MKKQEEPKKVLTEEDIWSKEDIDAVTDYINKETLSTKLHKGEVVDESYPKEFNQETLEEVKDLNYWKNNAEEDYLAVPISVLRYISELEEAQERSYSEEDIKNAFKVGFSIGYGSDVYAIDEKNRTCDEWFKQFKKK
jgi:hypothetical protein